MNFVDGGLSMIEKKFSNIRVFLFIRDGYGIFGEVLRSG